VYADEDTGKQYHDMKNSFLILTIVILCKCLSVVKQIENKCNLSEREFTLSKHCRELISMF